jgi:chromosome segregation ATPase
LTCEGLPFGFRTGWSGRSAVSSILASHRCNHGSWCRRRNIGLHGDVCTNIESLEPHAKQPLSGANEGIKELEKEQERLTALLKPHEDAIRTLKIELSGLDLRRDELAAALRSVEALHKQTSILRTSVQDNIDFARQTKLALERTRLKLADIVQTLQDCQYEETRRLIAIRLREVLATIQAGSAKKAIEPEQLRKATQYLTDIDNKTVEVVRVLTMTPKQLQA